MCESYGNDLLTGAPLEPVEYRSLNPGAKAIIKASRHTPAPEVPSEDYPLQLTTGRTLYQFHTRTKTARAPQLQAAAPEPWVELSERDAAALGIDEGHLVEITTPRGSLTLPARITAIREGLLFVPFHYGSWDEPGGLRPDGATRAANELTITAWDPVSNQPTFKLAAARAAGAGAGSGRPAPAPTTTASAPVRSGIAPTAGGADALAREEEGAA